MGRYEIDRSEAIIMASRETRKERIATHFEWKAMLRQTANSATEFLDKRLTAEDCAGLATAPGTARRSEWATKKRAQSSSLTCRSLINFLESVHSNDRHRGNI